MPTRPPSPDGGPRFAETAIVGTAPLSPEWQQYRFWYEVKLYGVAKMTLACQDGTKLRFIHASRVRFTAKFKGGRHGGAA